MPDFSTVISEGNWVCGGTGRWLGRGAGRGTAEGSAGARDDCISGLESAGEGLGVFAGSALSVLFGFGVESSESLFFFGEGDLSASDFGLFFVPGLFVAWGVSLALALLFGFGVTSSSS